MPAKTVNSHSLGASPNGGSRYAALARLLGEEIESGRYKVGQKIPTEAQLQQRFDVSRHTVREALRDLKVQGVLLARAGVGTVVRAKTPRTRFMQGIGTLSELVQFVEATRMKVLARREVIADADLAERLSVKPGQQLHEATVLRFLPKETVPVASMFIYLRAEHGAVLRIIDKAGQPIFSLVERQFGIRIVEVRQQIVPLIVAPAQARLLKVRGGTPALEISRQYLDSQDRMVMASIGIYPGERFSHNTRFRIQHSDAKDPR